MKNKFNIGDKVYWMVTQYDTLHISSNIIINILARIYDKDEYEIFYNFAKHDEEDAILESRIFLSTDELIDYYTDHTKKCINELKIKVNYKNPQK